jgi:uncharacterized damage-inducible protein DinB
MDTFAAPVPDERGQLLAYLDVQRRALGAAVRGLTDEQARSTPTASSMSLAGLLKHVVATERRWVVAGIGQRPEGIWPVEDWDAEWRPEPRDTVAQLLADLATVAAETATVVGQVPDLAALVPSEGSDGCSARWVLLHVLEELARHAGHADLLREAIDGATADRLGS